MPWGIQSENKAASNKVKHDKQKLEKGLDELRKLAPLPQVDQLYRYLAKVYSLGRTLPLSNDKKAQAALIARVPNIRMKGGFNRFRVLVELTIHTATNKKLRGRYARALQAVHRRSVPSSDFVTYVQVNGGVNRLGDQKIPKAARKKKKSIKPPATKSAPKSTKDDWS